MFAETAQALIFLKPIAGQHYEIQMYIHFPSIKMRLD